MANVLYHNDGKGKTQSHEIYSKDLENHLDVFLQGFGSTKEEAFQEFTERLDEFIEKLNEFKEEINIDKTVKVDFTGKPI
jgi:predicted RNase H-like HicB family nuclease